jgi:hypothetical protein
LREEGYQPPDPEEQKRREAALTQPVGTFDEMMQRILVVGTYHLCQRRGWALHGAGTDPSHLHALISWKR